MRKKIIFGIIFLLFLFGLRFFSVYLLNEKVILEYEKGHDPSSYINLLYTLNLNLSYIDYYNHGNLYYQKEEYENAIDRYEIALTKNPPKKRVCDIRINLSLATVKLAIMKKDTSYLKKAREILYQDDCAHEEDDTGSSKDAEKLEQEIKELEKSVVGEDPENPDPNEDPNPDPEIPNEKNIEEQLKQEIIQNNQIRNENIQTWENLNNYEYYNGKSW